MLEAASVKIDSASPPSGTAATPPPSLAGASATWRTKPRLVAARGFTLMELMVAILVIAILAALAMPTMQVARADRRAYDDAASIAGLLRSARLLAVGHGSAVVVMMTQGTGDAGTFRIYEAVPVTSTGAPRPVASCFNGGAAWTLSPADATLITTLDGVNLNGQLETKYSITSSIRNTADVAVGQAAICITPLGRTYYSTGSSNPTFAPTSVLAGALRVVITRTGGLTRSVRIPPTGVARLESQ